MHKVLYKITDNILNTLDNVSQLRNIWLLSSEERLAFWREFRLELTSCFDLHDKTTWEPSFEAIDVWWKVTPEVSVSMDPYSVKNWPTVWEIIAHGACCKYSRGLAMAYNAYYMCPELSVTVDLVYDQKDHDEYLMTAIENEFFMNTLQGSVVSLRDVDHIKIQESWPVKAVLTKQEK